MTAHAELQQRADGVTKPTESEFLAHFDAHYAVQRVAKAVHFERHHDGMRTNGPSTVELPTELVEYLLSRWRREP